MINGWIQRRFTGLYIWLMNIFSTELVRMYEATCKGHPGVAQFRITKTGRAGLMDNGMLEIFQPSTQKWLPFGFLMGMPANTVELIDAANFGAFILDSVKQRAEERAKAKEEQNK